MKYLALLLISTTLFLQGCKAQSNIMKNQNITIPEMDNSFEKFDIETFNSENIRGKRTQITEDFFLEEDLQSPGYAYQLYSNSSYFSILKLFFQNGNIEKKGIAFNNGSEYGVWYEFNEQGNLIKEIDTDEGYNFGWEQVIHYCERKKIELTKGHETSGFQTTIYKEESEEGNKIWKIEYQSSGDETTEIVLDGKTGKELSVKIIPYENN